MIRKPLVLAVGIALRASAACPQDVPGVEVCTMEKSMVRRTSCLQSNVDFLQKLISKNASESQQKLDAARRAMDHLKSAVAILQKAYRNFKRQRKKENSVHVFRQSKARVIFGEHVSFLRWKGKQQPNAKRDEETERCGYNDPHQFRQAPMIDATSTQTQGRQCKRPTRADVA
jgi:hypothetical protein